MSSQNHKPDIFITTVPSMPELIITPEQQEQVDKIVLKAKLELMQHRFFGSMALTMKWVQHCGVETYATDFIHIYYNPFCVLREKTVKSCAASLCHETLHKIMGHSIRAPKGEDHQLVNWAMDLAINPILVDEGWSWIADPSCTDFIYEKKYHGWNFEKILADLKKNNFQVPQPFQIDVYACPALDFEGKAPVDKDGKPIRGKEANSEQKQMMEIQLKSQLINAYESHKSYGLKSGNLKDLIKGLKESYVDWKSVLQRKVIGDHPENYSWRRPNRRFIHQDIYMPSVERLGVGDIYLWPDSSGSMGQKEMEAVASEMKYIIQVIQPDNVYVVELDSSIHGVKHFPKGSTPEAFDFKGRGGTDPGPFFKYVSDQVNVHCAICLTDMGFSYNIPQPFYPTIWISVSEITTAPFGTLIKIPVAA